MKKIIFLGFFFWAIGLTVSAQIGKSNHRPSILFLCTGNSCRSQMAEGWGRFLLGKSFVFFSAGNMKKGLNPKAVRVMKEAGVDISSHTSKLISELPSKTFDYVITVCDNAKKNCPFQPSKVKMIHHPFDDPPAMEKKETSEEENLKNYRRVRDEIREFVESLPENLKQGHSSVNEGSSPRSLKENIQ